MLLRAPGEEGLEGGAECCRFAEEVEREIGALFVEEWENQWIPEGILGGKQ